MMFRSIIGAATFQITDVLLCMGVALVLGIAIALFYMRSGFYTKSFVVVLSLLPLLVQSVIMIVNGNIGTSVAVLGAFGLIRFRSIPGGSREIGSIFFAMATGLAVGLGFLTLAALLTLITGFAMIVLAKTPFGESSRMEKQLKITVPEDLNYPHAFDDLFEEYTKKTTLERVRTTNMGTMYELLYHTQLKDEAREKEFLDDLRCRNGNLTVMIGTMQQNRDEL